MWQATQNDVRVDWDLFILNASRMGVVKTGFELVMPKLMPTKLLAKHKT